MLPPEVQSEILSLHFGQRKSTRAIARELGICRKSVRIVLARRSVALTASGPTGRGSILDLFKGSLEELLRIDPKIPASVLFQRARDAGFLGGYSVVQEWVRKKRTIPSRNREAFLRIEFAAGECAQVDWGEFGDVFGDGVKVHCFVMVLCYSRLLYIEFTRSEKFEEFIRCHENAFKFFGNLVPQSCWYDNLRSAVTDRLGKLIRFNARFMAYMGHHGIKPHACNPARGNEKGRVEDSIKYIRSSFWPGREFKNFEDLCEQARDWRDRIANKREHRSTRKVPTLHFETEEKPYLRPMNPHPYDTCEVFSRVVPPNFHVVYDTNRYSVPWTLVGMTLTVRVTERELKIFYNNRHICWHERSYKKHQIFTRPEHMTGLLERKPAGQSREGWQMQAIKNIGPSMQEYLDLLRSGQRSLRTEISKILGLATIYGDALVHDACQELLSYGVVGVENLELALKSKHHPSNTELLPAPLNFQNAKLNRVVPTVDLRRFDALLFESTSLSDSASTQLQGEENHANNSNHSPEPTPDK